jgi:hypothetical protein
MRSSMSRFVVITVLATSLLPATSFGNGSQCAATGPSGFVCGSFSPKTIAVENLSGASERAPRGHPRLAQSDDASTAEEQPHDSQGPLSEREGRIMVAQRKARDPRQALMEEFESLAQHPEKWDSLPLQKLKHFTFAQILRYGTVSDSKMIPDLHRLYRVFGAKASFEDRNEVLEEVFEALESGISSADALLPFMYEDPAPGIVTGASLKMALITPLKNGDALTGPKAVCEIARQHASDDQMRGRIVGGLLLLGDRRILPILDGCMKFLGPEGRGELSRAWSGFAYASAIDFYLKWLTRAPEDEYGSVAGTLARVAMSASPRKVLDVERKFPSHAPDNRPAIRYLREWTIEEYGRIIATRLRELNRKEQAPKVMPSVMRAWGVRE